MSSTNQQEFDQEVQAFAAENLKHSDCADYKNVTFGKIMFGEEKSKLLALLSRQDAETAARVRREVVEYIKSKLPRADKPKLGSENQDEYVAYSHGFNDCLQECSDLILSLTKE